MGVKLGDLVRGDMQWVLIQVQKIILMPFNSKEDQAEE